MMRYGEMEPRKNAAQTLQPVISSLVKSGVNPQQIQNTISGYYDNLGGKELASPAVLQDLLGKLSPTRAQKPMSISDFLMPQAQAATPAMPTNVGMLDTPGFNPTASRPLEVTVRGGPRPFEETPFEDQPIGDPKTLSGRIQEWLGAREPVQNGQIEQILSNRGKTEYGDIGEAAVQTLLSGKPVSSQSLADARLNDAMKRMDMLDQQRINQEELNLRQQTLDENIRSNKATEQMYRDGTRGGADTSGGATGILIQRYMESTGASFPEALYAVQTGMRQNMGYDNGQISPLPGAVDAKGQMAFGNKLGMERGEAVATAQMDLPRIEANAQHSIDLLQELIDHPGLSTSVGIKGVTGGALLGYIPPGTDAADFKSRLDQIKGQQFLQAYQTLKGGGQITEVEGVKAENAIARMGTAQTESQFKAAAKEFQNIIATGVDRARQSAGMGYSYQPPVAPAPMPENDDVFEYMTPEERALFQ